MPRYYALLVVDEPYLCQGGVHLCIAPFNGEGKSPQVGRGCRPKPFRICSLSLAKTFCCFKVYHNKSLYHINFIISTVNGFVAEWSGALPVDQEVVGSNPGLGKGFVFKF